MPDLRNSQNEPTGAIQGVLNMLRRLHKDYPSDYSACVFDAKGKTFRDDIYPDYKANRASMPDDLRPQIEPLHEAIKALRSPDRQNARGCALLFLPVIKILHSW
jgi:DNA polymerase-1